MSVQLPIDLTTETVAAILAGSCTTLMRRAPSGKPIARTGDILWVREPHRWRGAMYASLVPEEYANEPGELDWSCAEIEWSMVHGAGSHDAWEVCFPDDFMYGKAFGYEEIDDPAFDEGPDVAAYLSERLPARRMPRWASRLSLAITDAELHPETGLVAYRFEAIKRNLDAHLGRPRKGESVREYRTRKVLGG